MDKLVLDVCSGSRMMWFNKADDRALFGDIRSESHTLCDGRSLEIKPDSLIDFRDLPYDDESFNLIVFDPPHLKAAGKTGWIGKKYGILNTDWREDLRLGFSECFRVLKTGGTLVFKWNEIQIPTKEVLTCTPMKPLFGHISGKRSNTHWICFLK
jgi:SAM-dependent methyltransferase